MKYNINYLTLALGVLMIITSAANYFMNEDFISLGIFIFAGLGFIKLSVKSKTDDSGTKADRYAFLFFTVSILFLSYWVMKGKLGVF